jgi:F-BAR domain only protein
VASDLANLSDPSITSPPTDGVRTNPMSSLSPLGGGKAEDSQNAADAQSIRSSRSQSSMGAVATRHPEMTAPGLNASIAEIVSATLSSGQVTKVTTLGEIALIHNGHEGAAESETLRLDNFQVLEKVAPNLNFITPIEGKPGEYTVALPTLSHMDLGFKYQVHLDETNLAAYAPVLLTPMWKVEPTQTSVILNYAFNPAFASEKRAAFLQNAVVSISVENAKASACQSKPSGVFSKEKGMIYWRLGDVHLEEGTGSGKLLARFTTETEGKAGTIEARWEISGDNAAGVGSGLGLSVGTSGKDKEANPFEEDEGSTYKELPVQRKLISGKYVAT